MRFQEAQFLAVLRSELGAAEMALLRKEIGLSIKTNRVLKLPVLTK